jgi:hypothetical protein
MYIGATFTAEFTLRQMRKQLWTLHWKDYAREQSWSNRNKISRRFFWLKERKYIYNRKERVLTWGVWNTTHERLTAQRGVWLRNLNIEQKNKEEIEMYNYLFPLGNMPSESTVWFYYSSKQNPRMSSSWTHRWRGSKIITQRGVDVGGFSRAHTPQWSASISWD